MRLRYSLAQHPLEISTDSNCPYVLNGEVSPGQHRLRFTFYFSTWSGAQILDAYLLLSGPTGTPEIGRAFFHPASDDFARGGRLDFVLELDSRRLERICDLRARGADMQLRATLTVFASGAGGIQRITESETLKLSPSNWFSALDRAGFGDVLVSEFLIPRAAVEPNLASAITVLRDAVAAFRDTSGNDAHSRNAVATCRLAFEGGVLDAAKHPNLPGQNQTMPMTKAERLQTLRWAVKLVGHLAHHDPNVQWSKRDSRLLILLTGALLEWEAGRD